jgi:hypothetical protein
MNGLAYHIAKRYGEVYDPRPYYLKSRAEAEG